MDKDHNLLGVVRVLLKWKRQIIIATVAAGVIAALYSWFFMDDYYKSYATLYPVNLAYNDRAAIFNLEHSDYYGGKEDVNRVLTISQSAPIAAAIIEKYKLADHYKINKEKKYWKTKVRKEFDQNYKSIKTDQGAIEISIYDTDPQTAVNIINDVIGMTDSIYRGSVLDAKKQQIATFKKQVDEDQKMADRYNDTLAILGKEYAITVKAGADGTVMVEGKDYKAVQIYKGILAKQKNMMTEINFKSNISDQIENSLQNDNKSLSVIDAPTIADRKEKPIRSLIVVTVMLLTLVVSVFGALIADQVEDIRRQL